MKTLQLLACAVCIAVSAAAAFADTPAQGKNVTSIDLKIDKPNSGWYGTALVYADDPLGKMKDKVAALGPSLGVYVLKIDPPVIKEMATLSFDAFVQDGVMSIGLGDTECKGYFIVLDKKNKITLSARLSGAGQWEALGSTDTNLPAQWVRFKITCFKDGTIDIYANGELYIEKVDKRLPLAPVSIYCEGNGDGKRYVANTLLETR